MKTIHKNGNSTKEKIQEAAVELFTQNGYSRTTTSAIAKKAGVNELTVFRTFGSKKELLYDVYFLLTPVAEHVELSGLTHGKNLEKDLAFFFKSYLELHLKHVPAYRLSLQMQEEVYDRDLYYASFAKIAGMIAQFVEYLEEMGRAGKVAAFDYPALAEYMFSQFLVKSLEFTAHGESGTETDEKAVRAFVRDFSADLAVVLAPGNDEDKPSRKGRKK